MRNTRHGAACIVPRFALCVPLLPLLASCIQPVAGDRPHGIVSIDYCADQMVLGLVDRSRIKAVSVDADDDPLHAAPLAKGIPRVRPDVERILALNPALVVRSYGGGPRLEAALARAGVPVFTLPHATDLADIDGLMALSGDTLAAERAASRLRTRFSRTLARARGLPRDNGTILYMTPGDVTTGPGSMVAALFDSAGYRSYEPRPGWHKLPVERLVATAPDLVVRGFFETSAHQQDRWSSSAHGSVQAAITAVPTLDIPGGELSCGNWLVGHALDRLVAASERGLRR